MPTLTAVYLRGSLINRCAHCIDRHSRELRARNRPWPAETVTRVSTTGVPDGGYRAASAHFDEKELVDPTLAIGMMNVYNMMAISFRTVPAAAAG